MSLLFRAESGFRSEADLLRDPAVWTGAYGGPIIDTVSGEKLTDQRAMALPVVFACIKRIAGDMGRMPIVMKRMPDDSDGDVVEERDHELSGLLRHEANPHMNRNDWVNAEVANYVLWGMGMSAIERQEGRPVALWPIHPTRHKRTYINAAGELAHEIYDGNPYAQNPGLGKVITIMDRDMLVFKGPAGDGYTGACPWVLLRDTIGKGIAATKFEAAFFRNGLTLSGAVEFPVDADLDEPEKDAFELKLKNDFTGNATRAHKFMVLYAGGKFTKMASSLRDAQAKELREFTVQEICGVFGIDPSFVGYMLSAQGWKSSLEHRHNYLVGVLHEIIETFQIEMRKKLLFRDEWDRYAWEFDTNALIRLNKIEAMDFVVKGRGSGVIASNEGRRILGLPRYSGDEESEPADRLTVQGAFVPIEDLGKEKPAPGGGAFGEEERTTTEDTEEEEERDGKGGKGSPRRRGAEQEEEEEENGEEAWVGRSSRRDDMAILAGVSPLFARELDRFGRREAKWFAAAAKKHAGDEAGFSAAAEKFYAEHVELRNAAVREVFVSAITMAGCRYDDALDSIVACDVRKADAAAHAADMFRLGLHISESRESDKGADEMLSAMVIRSIRGEVGVRR